MKTSASNSAHLCLTYLSSTYYFQTFEIRLATFNAMGSNSEFKDVKAKASKTVDIPTRNMVSVKIDEYLIDKDLLSLVHKRIPGITWLRQYPKERKIIKYYLSAK